MQGLGRLTLRRRQVAQAILRLRMGPLDSFLALAPSFKDLTLAASSTSSFLLSAERHCLWVGLSSAGRTGEEILVLMGVNMMLNRWQGKIRRKRGCKKHGLVRGAADFDKRRARGMGWMQRQMQLTRRW